MLTQRLANIVFAVTTVIACVFFWVIAQGFETTGLLASSGLPSKFFPQLILVGTGLCAIIVAVLYWRRGHAGGDSNEMVFSDIGEARRGLLMLVVAVICYLVWRIVGFIPMAILLGPMSLLAMGIRSIWIYLTVLALTGAIYIVFAHFLGVRFS